MKKVELDIVIFESAESAGASFRKEPFSPRTREEDAVSSKKPVVKKMLMDVDTISKYSLRHWDNKFQGRSDKWTCLFDKLKHGEIIIIAQPLAEVREMFVRLKIINVLN